MDGEGGEVMMGSMMMGMKRHLRNRRQRGWTEREGSGEERRGWRIRPQRRQGLNIFDSLS